MDARSSVTDVSYETQHIWRSHSDMLGYNALSTGIYQPFGTVCCLHLQNRLQPQWSNSEVKWSEKKWSGVLGNRSTMYIRVTLYWGYLTVMWLFHLACLYCGCFNLFSNVWVSICGSVLTPLCGCFRSMCVLVFTVFCIVRTMFLYCFVYVYLFLFALSVLV
jgi:hypothetical protein